MTQRDLVQVTREMEGVTYHVFKTTGVRDPLEFDLFFQVDATPVPIGYEPYMMYSSNFGTRGAAGKGRWGVCTTCGYEAPVPELAKINGRYYCRKHRCNEDFV